MSPCQVTANDLQENITKLNNGVTFMIKHSQKLFKVSVLGILLSCLHHQETECPLSRLIPHVEYIFCRLSSAVGEGDLLEEIIPVVTREEVFSGQAALEMALPGQVSSTVQCNTPLCWTPAPAARQETWLLRAGTHWAALGFWQDKEMEGICPA